MVRFVLVHFRAHFEARDQGTGHKHEREERVFTHVESAAGGLVRAAAPELWGCGVPARPAQRAGRGAGQAGIPDAGSVTELQAASGSSAGGTSGGRRAEEAPSQQAQPGGTSDTNPGPGRDDAHDVLRVSSKTPTVCKC